MAAKTTPESIKQIHYLAGALKAPRITEAAERLAEQARDAGWTHEDWSSPVFVVTRFMLRLVTSGIVYRTREGYNSQGKNEVFPDCRTPRYIRIVQC
jgi:hypothetical protein